MKWVVVKEVVAVVAVVVLVAVPVAGRAGWVAPRLPVPAATASAPVAGTGSPTWRVSPVIRQSARSAARRWCANKQLVIGSQTVSGITFAGHRRSIYAGQLHLNRSAPQEGTRCFVASILRTTVWGG